MKLRRARTENDEAPFSEQRLFDIPAHLVSVSDDILKAADVSPKESAKYRSVPVPPSWTGSGPQARPSPGNKLYEPDIAGLEIILS
jgi:hypothetical protein